MLDFTTLAIPIANRQVYESVPLSALVADRRCCFPTPNGFHALTTLFHLPVHLEHEVTKSKVRDFTSPEAFHASKVQVLKEQPIKLAHEFQSQFPVVVSSLSFNLSVSSRQMESCFLAIAAASHFVREIPISLFTFLAPSR